MSRRYNKQGIFIKELLDKIREDHEANKFAFYNMDDSEGARLLMKNTNRKGYFKARYLNPDSLRFRNSLFNGRKDDNV